MKIKVTFKDADAVCNAIQHSPMTSEMGRDEKYDLERILSDFFEYGEYVTVEVDLDSGEMEIVR